MVKRNDSELMQAVVSHARSAEAVFATHADLRDWLVCVVHQRLHGDSGRPGGRCGKVAAAACAVRFRRACPLSSTPSELDEIVGRLPTSRLEALLRLAGDNG